MCADESPDVPAADDLLTIGELSRRSGVAASALRFYERHGLIHSERTPGNQRRYRRNMLRRVAFVRAGQRVGVPLVTIRGALDQLPAHQAPSPQDWARAADVWRVDLDERLARLVALRDRLGQCIGCGCLSLDWCALANPADRIGRQAQGAPGLEPQFTRPDPTVGPDDSSD